MAKGYGGSKRAGGKAGGYMKCTRTTNPPTQDKSRVLKGPSVSKDACRHSTTSNQRPLGPRTA